MNGVLTDLNLWDWLLMQTLSIGKMNVASFHDDWRIVPVLMMQDNKACLVQTIAEAFRPNPRRTSLGYSQC